MKDIKLVVMMEIAICAAMAIVLDQLVLFKAPQGGSVGLTMLPILLIALRHGTKVGLITGTIAGILQLIVSPYYVHPVQIFLDYILAFAGVGFAGLVSRQVKSSFANGNKKSGNIYIVIGSFIGTLVRYIAAVLSGVIFFGSYAPEGTPVIVYSTGYNAWYLIPSFIICALILALIVSTAPVLVNSKNK